MADEPTNPTNPEDDAQTNPEEAVDNAQDAAEAAAEAADDGAPASSAEEEALAAAAAALNSLNDDAGDDAPAAAPDGATDVELPDFAKAFVPEGDGSIELLSDVKLNVRIELGRTHMLVEDILKLGSGAVVELDKLAGDPVDVFVNDRHVARGEVLVLNDNFCVRVSEILAPNGESEATA